MLISPHPETALRVEIETLERHAEQVPDLAHLIALERQEDDNRVAASRREMARSSGVCMSGMGAEPWPRRSDAQLHAAAEARRQRLIERRAGVGPTMFKGAMS